MKQIKINKQISSRGSAALDTYLNEIGTIELLRPEREIELAVKINDKKNSEDALGELVNANLRFVVSVAKQFQNQGLSLGDLISEGNFGLIKAAKRFDEKKGFKFISYAVWWIRQSILQAISEQSKIIRIPLNKIGQVNKINKTCIHLEQKFEREPTADEVAEYLGVSASDVVDAKKTINDTLISLDKGFQQGEDTKLQDTLPNDGDRPDFELDNESLRKDLEKLFSSTLTKREAMVIELYYGLRREETLKTLEEIGNIMSLTRERVRQIKEKALLKLRNVCKDKKWRDILSL